MGEGLPTEPFTPQSETFGERGRGLGERDPSGVRSFPFITFGG